MAQIQTNSEILQTKKTSSPFSNLTFPHPNSSCHKIVVKVEALNKKQVSFIGVSEAVQYSANHPKEKKKEVEKSGKKKKNSKFPKIYRRLIRLKISALLLAYEENGRGRGVRKNE